MQYIKIPTERKTQKIKDRLRQFMLTLPLTNTKTIDNKTIKYIKSPEIPESILKQLDWYEQQQIKIFKVDYNHL